MDSNLRARASSHFEQYLQDWLTRNETVGLPAERLTESEWQQLNDSLKSMGVRLVPKVRNGILYYWFTNTETAKSEAEILNQGREKIIDLLVKQIKEKYSNLPEANIRAMIEAGGNYGDIYEKLRYKQDGQYNDISKEEFEDAVIYALQSCGNKNELIQLAFYHHWDPSVYYETNALNMSFRGFDWPDNRIINMDGGQDWTWFRSCDGAIMPPVYDPKNPKGFHLSLNVRVTSKLLKALDDILMADGGRYIQYYKFPKADYYTNVVTRYDPVTIYMYSRNPELEARIVRAIQPFVRSSEGLTGEMLGRGISISPETSEGSNSLSVGQKISQDIAHMINQYSDRL